MRRTIYRPLIRYGLAVATVALMMWFKTITDAQFGDGSPLILFLCAVMITARCGGPGPGATATILSALVCAYFYSPTSGSSKVLNANDALRLFVFVVEGLALSGLMGSLISTREAAEETAHRALRQEEALRESEERLRLLVEGVRDYVIIMLDPDGRVASWNTGSERIKGYTAGEILGEHFSHFYTPEDRLAGKPDRELAVAEATGRFEEEGWRLRKDGSRYWAGVTTAAVRDVSGRLRGFAKVSRDLTERRNVEEAIRRSHDELEQRVRERTVELELANIALQEEVAERWKAVEEARSACLAAETATRAKGEFLANMSHEIRTPMNGVLGMLDLVLRSDLPRRQHEFLNLAKSSADTLLRLLNDILDFSKIEAGRLDLESTPFSIRETLGDSLKSLAVQVHEKGLELSCSIAPNVPEGLVGDPGRLSQVVGNLVGNAQKFTERGEIAVRVELEAQDNGCVLLHFAVRDTGVGVSPEKQQLIFAPFTQADSSTTRQYGGTGLGLAISSHLVDAMGGRIWLESLVGQGSTFHFTARFGVHDIDLRKPSPPRLDLAGLPVLVVDDNPTQRCILEELLLGWRMRPTAVASGPAGIAAMKEARDSGEPYALVLLDVLMPGMDGFQVAEWIQRDSELAGTAVMMVSSADFRGDSERCAAVGVSVFLRKPVKASELFDSILSVLGLASPTRAESSSTDAPPLPEPTRLLKILLAEDTPVNQRLVVTLLEDRGHTVVIANDGQEALDLHASSSFDLILMDVQMPRVDGFQATAAIRTAEAGTDRRIPIIAMTAHAMKGDRERCLAAGMDAYISKPIRAERFLSVVEGWTLPPEGPEATQDVGDLLSEAVFDLDAALARTRGKRSLLTKMGEIFLADYPHQMAEIRAALVGGDARTLERAGHRLKGSAGSLCARRVVTAAQRLEEVGRDGDFEKAEPVSARLEQELVRFEHALKVWDRGNDE